MTRFVVSLYAPLFPILRRMGVDVNIFRATLILQGIHSQRSVMLSAFAGARRGERWGWGVLLAFLCLLGTIPVWPILLFESLFTALTWVYTFVAFLSAACFILFLPGFFFYAADEPILSSKPVNDRTLWAVRLAHLMNQMSVLVVGFSLVIMLVGMIQVHLLFPIPYMVMAFVMVFLVVCGVGTGYVMMIRILGANRFRKILLFFQFLVLTVPFLIAFLVVKEILNNASLAGLRSFQIQSVAWLCLFPPAWMAAPVALLFEEFNWTQACLSIQGFFLFVLCFILWIWLLVSKGVRSVMDLERIWDQEEIPWFGPQWHEWGTRWICRKREERIFYRFLSGVHRRDWRFKFDLYACLVPLGIVLFLAFILERSAEEISMFSRALVLSSLYFPLILGVFCLQKLSTSERSEASWVYFSLPIESPASILRASIKWVCLRFILPLFMGLTLFWMFCLGPGILLDILYASSQTILLLVIYERFFCLRLPLAVESRPGIPLYLWATITAVSFACIPLTGFHFFLVSTPWVVAGLALLMILAAIHMMGTLDGIHWEEIRSKYGWVSAREKPSVSDALLLFLFAVFLFVPVSFLALFLFPPFLAVALGTLVLPIPVLGLIGYQGLPVRESLRFHSVDRYVLVLSGILGISFQGIFLCTGRWTTSWTALVFGENPYPRILHEVLPGHGMSLLGGLVALSLIPGLCEEILFRGGIQGILEKKGVGRGILITALLFALSHGNPWHFMELFFMGCVLGILVYRTLSLVPAILCHAASNAAAVLIFSWFSEELPWRWMGLWALLGLAAGWLLFSRTKDLPYRESPLRSMPKIPWKKPLLVSSMAIIGLMGVVRLALCPLLICGYRVGKQDLGPGLDSGDVVLVLKNKILPLQIRHGDLVAFEFEGDWLGRLKWIGSDVAVVHCHGKNYWVPARDIRGRGDYRVRFRPVGEDFGISKLSGVSQELRGHRDEPPWSRDAGVIHPWRELVEDDNPEGARERAERAWKERDWEQALAAFSLVAREERQSGDSWYWMGQALGRMKRFEEEMWCYERILSIEAVSDQARITRANTLFMLGRTEDAFQSFDDSIEMDPHNPEFFYAKGVALGHLGRYGEAVDFFQKALELNPKHEKAWRGRIAFLGRLGRIEEKIEAYKRLLEIDPTLARDWYSMGNACYQLRRYEESIVYHHRALEIDPRYVQAWYGKGKALLFLGRYDQAQMCFREAADLGHINARLWTKAMAYAGIGGSPRSLP